MTPRKNHPIKEKQVASLVDNISKSRTLMLVSIKGLPSKQFQEIKKAIRDHASVKVAKKNIMMRTIEKLGKDNLKPIEEHINENCAFVISDIEGYELAGILNTKKTPANAKAGQISSLDIEVKKGPTDLPPGPAISELGSVGLQIAVEEGKLSIKAAKVIVKEGQAITPTVASILQKLHIQPFTVGLEPVALYDIKDDRLYTEVKINTEETISNLVNAANKALGFAQALFYYCKDTIGYLLAKANSGAEAISKLSPKDKDEQKQESTKTEEPAPESVPSEGKEEIKESTEEKKEDDDQVNKSEESK
ncbi:50S ribosomal protein L10 [Candidatus Pacearchaeota archaeon]|nr:50S ribosomal protein L10 [Candidatus Pacearchaeota archaeon]